MRVGLLTSSSAHRCGPPPLPLQDIATGMNEAGERRKNASLQQALVDMISNPDVS